uniref:Uncharacterized protein n=1 Tax=virus sp. ctpeS3 TaxID=2826815 RepID=A0A8S5R9L8_9VIRU|nr:MAG TPA: hypothetical protein [virus sp. ctpeS3]
MQFRLLALYIRLFRLYINQFNIFYRCFYTALRLYILHSVRASGK